MTSRTASCVCGQLRITVFGETLGAGVCHCLACQKRTGSVFAALAAFAPPFVLEGEATAYVREGDRGSRAVFRFCPVCGSNVGAPAGGCGVVRGGSAGVTPRFSG